MNTNEIIKLCREKEGLKLGYEKYKRKYKAMNNILQNKLYYKILGLKVQEGQLLHRLSYLHSEEERKTTQALLNFVTREKEELETIYEMCLEVKK